MRPSTSCFCPPIVAVIFALLFGVATTGPVHAAGCYNGKQVLPPAAIAEFLANPAQLLQQYPSGGGQFIARVRDLAASDPATLPAIIQLIATIGNDDNGKAQKAGIGSGLAQAAKICVKSDQAYANQIQQAVAQSGDQAIILAFAATAGDQPIGAAGAGAGAGSPGASGGPAGTATATGQSGTGGAEGIGGPGTNTGQFTYTGAPVPTGVSNLVSQ